MKYKGREVYADIRSANEHDEGLLDISTRSYNTIVFFLTAESEKSDYNFIMLTMRKYTVVCNPLKLRQKCNLSITIISKTLAYTNMSSHQIANQIPDK